jgi:acyl-coenzyme A thioesterase PaaI-like protein
MTDRTQSLAVQDFYPDDFAHCYGCGRLNEHGHRLKSSWEGDELVAHFTPKPYHIAIPGFVYGGLIASLIDCHGMATASAVTERAAGRAIGNGAAPRFVTAALKIDYVRPTSLGVELVLRSRPRAVSGRKVVVDVTVSANGNVTVKAEVVAVPLPETMSEGN